MERVETRISRKDPHRGVYQTHQSHGDRSSDGNDKLLVDANELTPDRESKINRRNNKTVHIWSIDRLIRILLANS